MLTAGVATWLVITGGQVASGLAARDLRLASLALLAGGRDDTSEEWLRSLRGPAIQQPPPHSAE